MTVRNPPYGPQAPSGPGVASGREVAVSLDELQKIIRASGRGLPRQGLIVRDTQAQYGELLYCDPTTATADGNGVYINIRLPAGDRAHVHGPEGHVAVKNYSESTNRIRVWAAEGDTIDGAAYKDMAVARQLAHFDLIEGKKWISSRSDGCL